MRAWFRPLVLGLCLVTNAACTATLGACTTSETPPADALPLAVPPNATATEDEARAVALRYVTALETSDEAAFVADYDGRLTLARALRGQRLSPAVRRGFLESAEDSGPSLYRQHATMFQGASLRVLGTRTDADGAWAAIGAIYPDGRAGQLQLNVVNVDGKPRWVDVFNVLHGDRMSEVLRRFHAATLQTDGHLDAAEVRRLEVLATLSTPLNRGNPAGALAAYEALGPEAKGLQQAKELRVAAATVAGLPPDALKPILQDFVGAFPDAPSAPIRRVELAMLDGDNAAAAKAFEGLSATYPDAYLLVLASGAWIQGDNLPKAREAAEKAVTLEPELMEAWTQVALVSARQADDERLGAALTELGQEYGVRPEHLAMEPGWSVVVARPAYSEWAARVGG